MQDVRCGVAVTDPASRILHPASCILHPYPPRIPHRAVFTFASATATPLPMSDASANLWKSLQSPRRLFLIAGPCVIESEKLCLQIARSLKKTCAKLGVPYIFKASFDKANRTSGNSFRGPGVAAGLEVLARVRHAVGVPVLTDVHTEAQAALAGEVVDVLQIPAFLCRQTDLIQAAVRTGKIVNIKKGQFLAPQDMGNVVAKAVRGGAKKLLLTERGTTFGYNNLVSDMRAMPIMRE